jgi:hypothetical protein
VPTNYTRPKLQLNRDSKPALQWARVSCACGSKARTTVSRSWPTAAKSTSATSTFPATCARPLYRGPRIRFKLVAPYPPATRPQAVDVRVLSFAECASEPNGDVA